MLSASKDGRSSRAKHLSASKDVLITGSLNVFGDTITTGSTYIQGDIRVDGTGSFNVVHTTYETSSIIYSSGSTKFGDTLDDTHQFTGSVEVTGSFELTGSLNVSGSLIVNGPIASTVFENSYSSDAEAGAAGVPIYGIYRNGSFVVVKLS